MASKHSNRTLLNVIEKGDFNLGSSERKRCPRTHHKEADPSKPGAELFVRNGYRAEICPGEAHSNAHIDNCSLCAPLWGVRAVKLTTPQLH